MNTLFHRSSLLALATLAGSASAQVGAYEGFGYPAGSAVAGQSGGSGFSTPWQSAGYGGWQSSSQSLSSLRVWQLMQGQNGSAASSSGGLQRSLSSPITGASGSTVWISFIARHTGPTAASWLGLKLPCSGPGSDPFLFIGKPYGLSTWGVDNGVSGGARGTTVPASSRVRCVAAITFRDGRDDVTLWTNPELGAEPGLPSADLHLPGYASLSDLRRVLIETGTLAGEVSNTVDEIRIGSSYAEVTPVAEGLMLDGFRVTAGDANTVISGSGSGAACRVDISNLPGTRGVVTGVALNSSSGGGVTVVPGDLSASGGEIKIKHRGWDGLIYGTHRMASGPGGTIEVQTDLSGLPITAVRTVAVDGEGVVVHDETDPGPLGHIINNNGAVVVSGPCPDGGFPEWRYVTVFYNPPIYKNFDWIAFEQTWVFGCPGASHNLNRNTITTYGICDPAAVIDPGLAALEVSSDDLATFALAGPSARFGGAQCSGTGEVLVAEECDGSDCTDASRRKLVINNIGSSGEDGVELDWPLASPPAGGTVSLGDILESGGDAEFKFKHKDYVGHVTIMKQRVIGGGDGTGVVIPDVSELGSTEYRLVAYRDGTVIRDEVFPNLTPVDIDAQIICGPGKQLVWGWITMWVWNPWPVSGSYQTHWGVVGCMTVGTGGGSDPTYTDRVMFIPVNPSPVGDPESVEITASDVSAITILAVEGPVSTACNADFNQDGFLDFFDYDDFVLAFETGVGNADFNGDGFTDFFDYDDFVQSFETGC